MDDMTNKTLGALLSSGGLNLDCDEFKRLLDTQHLVDCTLACEGGKISAHKVVLSACSSYLAKILREHPVEHPIIILPELNIEDVKTLVHYMYTGELLRSNTLNSSNLLRTAAILSVNSLNDFLNSQATTTNNNISITSNDINDTSNANIIDATSTARNGLRNHSKNNFNNGSQTHTNPKSDFQFKCPVCQNDFQTICSFEYHMQRIHHVTSFGCEICHKPFASLRYVLTDHMRRCHGWKAEQKLQC